MADPTSLANDVSAAAIVSAVHLVRPDLLTEDSQPRRFHFAVQDDQFRVQDGAGAGRTWIEQRPFVEGTVILASLTERLLVLSNAESDLAMRKFLC